MRTLKEQPSSAVPQQIVVTLGVLRWDGERPNLVDLLALYIERLAARGDDPHPWGNPQHSLGKLRGRGNHMLAGVQHQQQLAAGNPLRNALGRNRRAWEFDAQRRRNRGESPTRIGDRGAIGQPHTVGKLRHQLTCDSKGKPCFTDAAEAGQRYEPMAGRKMNYLAQCVIPADQSARLFWQVRPRQYRLRLNCDPAAGDARQPGSPRSGGCHR